MTNSSSILVKSSILWEKARTENQGTSLGMISQFSGLKYHMYDF